MARNSQQQPEPSTNTDFYPLPAREQRGRCGWRSAVCPLRKRWNSDCGSVSLSSSGSVFIFGQGIEYAGLIAKSITPERNLFGATFFTLTGFHGLHVLCGLIAFYQSCWFLNFVRSFGPKRVYPASARFPMYWHFVDAVWIVIFSLVYVTVWI